MSSKPWLYAKLELVDLKYMLEFGEGSWMTLRLKLGSYKLETENPDPL